MPVNQFDANVWYYQDFLADKQGIEFLQNRPEDWSRVQVWDGNALKPAMEPGFQGVPTPEQIAKLYAHAQKEQLFFFKLGDSTPCRLHPQGDEYVHLNPQEPVAPVKPNVVETDTLMVSYHVYLSVYKEDQAKYQKNLETLSQLGDGFKQAVNDYNQSRDMQREAAEKQAYILNQGPEQKLRNREKADRVFDQVFGPKPVAAPDIFYKPGHKEGEAVIRYDLFEEQFQANAYDLPPNSKLSAQDVATINYAMLGAKEPVEQICLQNLGFGPLGAQSTATHDFQMLTTGLFGQPRINQQLVDQKIVGQVLKVSKDAIEQYNTHNNPAILGKYLGECVRNVKENFVSAMQDAFTQDLVAGTRLIERLQDLFERKPDLLQAAGLNDNEKEFMRGYSQMGKAYDNFLHGQIKMNEAAAYGNQLTTEEKTQILTDAVIRRMVEKELTKDKELVENSTEYLQKIQEAEAKDQAIEEEFLQWAANDLAQLPEEEQSAAQSAYLKQHDYNMNKPFVSSPPVDHAIIHTLAQPGMLEQLRQTLLSDPNIRLQAAKEPMEFGGDKLIRCDALDALVDKTTPVLKCLMTPAQQKQAWFDDMKALVTRGREGEDPNTINAWITAGVAGDAERLKIAVPNARGGKNLVRVSDLVEGGLQALENPNPKVIDVLYQNALEGNLYFYPVGKTMPQRLSADGAQAAAQQLAKPVEPNFFQWLINLIFRGRFYDDICNPKPDRDPAAMEGILRSQDGRTATIAGEIRDHRQVADELARQATQVNNAIQNFSRVPEAGNQVGYPEYSKEQIAQKLAALEANDLFAEKDLALDALISHVAMGMRSVFANPDASQEQIREVMAHAVLLETIKEEKAGAILSGDPNNRPTAAQMSQNRGEVVNSLMKNAAFREFTKDVSVDMLKHFFMVDGAKNMYQAMKNVAVDHKKMQEIVQDANILEQNVQQQNVNQVPKF